MELRNLTMSNRFRVIHPSDMSRLERIVELMSQRAEDFARRTADAIQEPVAREAADILVGRSNNTDPEYLEFVSDLKNRVDAFNQKFSGAAVA
jgi:hypothetical protein